MATLTLNGIRSIQEAEIDLTGPITLLTGDNGEGKTSVLLALKAILTGTTACISTKMKDDADGMCADGMTKRASAMLADEDGQLVATWSKAKCYPVNSSKSVAGLPHASKAAAGLPDFLAMPPNDRAQVFLEAFQIDPTQQDLTQGLTHAQLDVSSEEIWKEIRIHGWDGVHNQAAEKLTALKSDWRTIAGEQWTAERGEGWSPDCMTETTMPPAKLKELERHMVEAAEVSAKARNEFDAIIVPPAAGEELSCPHCSKQITLRQGALYKYLPVDEAERDRLLRTRNAMTGKVAGLADDARKAEQAFVAAQAIAAHSAEDRENRIERAAAVHEEIKTQQSLVEVLGPEGVRAEKRDQMLSLVNSQLDEMASRVGIEAINLVWGPEPGKQIPTICARMGARLYKNLSSSEQWRVRLVIQLLIAKRDGSNIILLDDCEILVRQRRDALVMLLKDCGINVLAAMSISDGARNAPDLEAAGYGQTYWVEGGKVLPLSEAKQTAVQKAA